MHLRIQENQPWLLGACLQLLWSTAPSPSVPVARVPQRIALTVIRQILLLLEDFSVKVQFSLSHCGED